MDFGDILTLLVYIAIPVYISGKRKAKKASKEAQQRGQPEQRKPMQGKTKDGGLMGRLESMMKELEKAAQSGKPAGGEMQAGGPARTVRPVESYTAVGGTPVTVDMPGGNWGQQVRGTPVWRVADEGKNKEAPVKPEAKEKLVLERVPVASAVAAEDKGYALFGKDDLVKGIILSEILQPPITLRQRNKRRPY